MDEVDGPQYPMEDPKPTKGCSCRHCNPQDYDDWNVRDDCHLPCLNVDAE